MIRFAPLLVALALLLLPTTNRDAAAQVQPGPGTEASAIGEVEWLINHPTFDRLEDLRGHVVLLQNFVYSPETNEQLIPRIQALHEEYGPLGLKVMAVGGEHAVEWDLIRMHRMLGATYPVGRGAMEVYRPGQTSVVWLIGADGTILWADQGSQVPQGTRNNPRPGTGRGRPAQMHYDGLDEAVAEAIDGLTTPGFPILEPTRDVARLARSWTSGDYGRVREQINRTLERGRSDEDTTAQMEFLLERIASMTEYQFAQAARYMEQGYFTAATATLESLSNAFSREEEAERAEAMLEQLESDELEAEVDAEAEFNSTLAQLIPQAGQPFDAEAARATLRSFAERNAGTIAAGRAEAMADQIEDID